MCVTLGNTAMYFSFFFCCVIILFSSRKVAKLFNGKCKKQKHNKLFSCRTCCAVAQLLHTPLFLLICHALFNLGLGFFAFFHFDCCLRINEFIFFFLFALKLKHVFARLSRTKVVFKLFNDGKSKHRRARRKLRSALVSTCLRQLRCFCCGCCYLLLLQTPAAV